MKKLLFLIIPFIGFSQDLKLSHDDFTNQNKIECTTQKQNAILVSSISKEVSLTITCYANLSDTGKKFMYLSANIATYNITCFSDHNGEFIFLFESGEQLKLKQISGIKCNTASIVLYELSEESLVKLLNNDIKKFKIVASETYFEGTIKKNKKQLVKDTFVTYSMNTNK